MADSPTTIGVYDGEHCGSFHVQVALRCMGLRCATFTDADVVAPGFGEDFAVLVFGAGHVSDTPTALGGAPGRQRIRDLISDGRLYLGTCAGAYLALFAEPKGLALAQHRLDRPETGSIFQGFLAVEYPLGSGREFPLWYQNGPVFLQAEDGAVARFAGEQACGAGRSGP